MLYVCSLHEMATCAERLRPSHLVSLNNPDELPRTPPCVEPGRHLRLAMHDVTEATAGCVLPEAEQVQALLHFVADWDGGAPLLIHCYAGVSRSMAAALITLHQRYYRDERSAAAALRAAAPHACPNRRLVALGDGLLGCEGRLLAARDAMGDPRPLERGPLVRITPPA